ncbi:uncharacterized protein M6G45_015436 [Spheniscus humboldti]
MALLLLGGRTKPGRPRPAHLISPPVEKAPGGDAESWDAAVLPLSAEWDVPRETAQVIRDSSLPRNCSLRAEASVGRRWAWMRSRLAEGLWLSILSRSRQTASGDAAVSQDVASRSDPLRSTRGCSLHMRFEFGAWSRAAPGTDPAAWETSPRLFQLTQFTAITVSRT